MTQRSRPVPPNARCHYCGAVATSMDHVVPISLGGRKDGVQVPACRSCNHRKADKMPTCECDTCERAVQTFQGRLALVAPGLHRGRHGYFPLPPEAVAALAGWSDAAEA